MNNVLEDVYWCVGDLETPTACPACTGLHLTVLYTKLMDQEEDIPGEWGMVRCDQCGSLCLSPRPTHEAIGKAYRSYYTHLDPVEENRTYNGKSLVWRWANGYLAQRFGDSTRAPSWFGAKVVSLLPLLRQQLDYLYRNLSSEPGRLLDVGCGNGAFMARAQSAGWYVQGIEPDHAAASQAVLQGFEVFEGGIADFDARASYDVITLAHVIEHLHDPVSMLAGCRKLLRPGGTMWIATPNVSSIGHRLFKEAWQPLETPRHIVMPTSRALVAMLHHAGFEDVRFIRRGRGSLKRLKASNRRAVAMGLRSRSVLFWALVVDLFASLSPFGAEELVVTARRLDIRK